MLTTYFLILPPKKGKIQIIASDILKGDIMNGDIVNAPGLTWESVCRWTQIIYLLEILE